MTYRTVTVDVEVEMDDFSDDDILDECEERGLGAVGDFRENIEEMFYAFKLGKPERAMELARKIAQDATGRIL